MLFFKVLADANFPAASVAHSTPGGLINCDGTQEPSGRAVSNMTTHITMMPSSPSSGNDIPSLLTAIMNLLPLDETAPPAILMGMVSHRCPRPCCSVYWSV